MKYALFAFVGLLALTASAHAYKQEDLDKLIKTRNCVECDQSKANQSGADRSGAELTGAFPTASS